MTPFTKAVRDKGWKMKELAVRWGMTPRGISYISNNPKPMHLDALAGLPEKEEKWRIGKLRQGYSDIIG